MEDKVTVWECFRCGHTEKWIDEDRQDDDDPRCPFCHREMWKKDAVIPGE